MLRLVYLRLHPPAPLNVYWALSDGLLRHASLSIDGQPTTMYEPLYPALLAVARWVMREPVLVDMVQIAIAAVGAVLLSRLTLTLTSDARVAVIAGALYAIDPLLIRETVGHSESALFTTLLIAFANAAVSADTSIDAVAAGAWLGLAILTRTTALPLLILAPAVMFARRVPWAAVALFVVTLLIVAPLPLRNHALNGAWWPTRSGINLYIGNSAYTRALVPSEDADLLQQDAAVRMTTMRPDIERLPALQQEREADLFFTSEAISYMRAHPVETIDQKLRNVWYVFSPRIVPYRVAAAGARLVAEPRGNAIVIDSRSRPAGEVITYALWSSVLLALAIIGAYQRRHDISSDAILWAIILTVTAVSVVYVPATRYRAPMEFAWIFYASMPLRRSLLGYS